MTAAHRKRSFKFCSETCPDVDREFHKATAVLQKLVAEALYDDLDRALAVLCEAVKTVGTEKLRDALDDACAELIEAEERADALSEHVHELEAAA